MRFEWGIKSELPEYLLQSDISNTIIDLIRIDNPTLNTVLKSIITTILYKTKLDKMLTMFKPGDFITTDRMLMAKILGSAKDYYSYYPHEKEPEREVELMAKFGTKLLESIPEILAAFTPMKTLQLSHNWATESIKKYLNNNKFQMRVIYTTFALSNDAEESDNMGSIEYGCFYENEKIITLTGSKRIKDLTQEDFVYTNGDFRPVKAVQRREHLGEMTGFYLLSTTDQLVSTPNHPFYVFRDDKFEWVEAKDLTLSDKLAIPVPVSRYAIKDKSKIGELLEFQVYGKSIGVGKISYRKEPVYAKNYIKEGNYYIVEDMDLWKRVHNYKYELPAEYLLLNRKNKKFIVQYYYDTVSKKSKNGVSFAFLSSALAYQFQLLLASLLVDSKIFGKFKNKKFAIVSIRKELAEYLFENGMLEYKNIIFYGNYMLVPIQTKFNFNYKGYVYNIEINADKDKDKVFTVKNVLVHNSYLNAGKMPITGYRIATGGEYFITKMQNLVREASEDLMERILENDIGIG